MANINIGKGESKTIIFNFSDIDGGFIPSDKLLFALKRDATSKEFLFTKEALIEDLPTENITKGDKSYLKYSFIVNIKTEFSRSLDLGDYFYDLTIIDRYGEEKPLIYPRLITVTKTIGASLERAGE